MHLLPSIVFLAYPITSSNWFYRFRIVILGFSGPSAEFSVSSTSWCVWVIRNKRILIGGIYHPNATTYVRSSLSLSWVAWPSREGVRWCNLLCPPLTYFGSLGAFAQWTGTLCREWHKCTAPLVLISRKEMATLLFVDCTVQVSGAPCLLSNYVQ